MVAADELDALAEADLGLVEQWAAQLDELGELIGSRSFGRSRGSGRWGM